ncbi:MAG: lytic transglycosylase domain-containing protein, partial [Hyphomicrobiales bacterium]
MTGAAVVNIPPQIRQAIQSASVRTGTGFDYLLDTAIRESGLKSDAKASSSSATGLFQFVEQTWLKTVQSTGAKYGLVPQAAAITRGPQGRYDVADAKLRAEIL